MEKISYKLESFEGPLDLLLHLISKHKLNIYDIQISELLDQYMTHIKLMESLDMEVASEFLEMASRLVLIKTAFLLPKHEEAEKLKEELTGQLLEYQECKEVAKLMAKEINLDYISREVMKFDIDLSYDIKHNINEILKSYITVMGKKKRVSPDLHKSFTHIVKKRVVSVISKAIFVLKKLKKYKSVKFNELFSESKSKSELVATFLAVLELVKGKRIKVDLDSNKELTVELNGGGKKWR